MAGVGSDAEMRDPEREMCPVEFCFFFFLMCNDLYNVVTSYPPSQSFSNLYSDHRCSQEKNVVFMKQEASTHRKFQSKALNQDGDFKKE